MIEMYSQPTVRRAIATHMINATSPAPRFSSSLDRRRTRPARRLRYVVGLAALGILLSLWLAESWM